MFADVDRYHKLIQAILKASQTLTKSGPAADVIQEVLEQLGLAANTDRCYIFQNEFKDGVPDKFNYQFEWVAKGVDSFLHDDMLKGIPWLAYTELFEILSEGKAYFTHTSDLKDLDFKEALEYQNIKSVLFTPVIYEGKFWGFIGFDDCKEERIWQAFEIHTLLSVSSILGSYLKRQDMALELEHRHAEMMQQKEFYETIFYNLTAGIVVFDRQKRYRFLNKFAVQNDDVREWLIGKDDFEYCAYRNKPIEIAEERTRRLDMAINQKVPVTFEEKFDLGNGKYKKHLRILHPVLNEYEEVNIIIGYDVDITRISEQEDLIAKQNETIGHSPVGIALLNAEGNYYYMNRIHESIFGYEPGWLIGKSWTNLYGPAEMERIANEIFPILNETKYWKGESVGISKTGAPVYQEIILKIIEDGTLICITQDVSPIKENLIQLEKAKQKLELALQSSQLGMWEWNLVTDELEGNDIYKKILGFEKEETFSSVMLNWMEAIHPDDRQLVMEALDAQKAQATEPSTSVYSMEYRIRHTAGHYIWVLDYGKVVEYDENGMPALMAGFIADISSKKIIEEKIKVSESRYRDLVVNLREVIFELSKDGAIVFLNPAWTHLTGFVTAESHGKTIQDFIDSSLGSESIKLLNEYMFVSPDHQLHMEIPLRSKEGALLWFDLEVKKRSTGESSVFMAGSMEDITQRKNAEAELKAALEKEKELGDLKSRFVSMASHEFRTPLAGIRSSAELMKMQWQKIAGPDSEANKSYKSMLDHIIFDVDRISALMTNVLTLGSIESAQVKLHEETLEINSFLSQYLETDAERYIQGQTLHFIPAAQAVQLRFDPKLIVHVLNNLVSNAAKYSHPSSVIDLVVSKGAREICICIVDRGIGIPSGELPFIKDSFFRSSNVENVPGTGLGLSIASYFVEAHGGRLEMESELGKGTKVYVYLPLQKEGKKTAGRSKGNA